MKLRDLLTQEEHDRIGDIDVYDDYDESVGIAFCGEIIKDAGKKFFEYALDLPAHYNSDESAIIVECKSQRDVNRLGDLMYSMAGYCTEEEWDEWFE